METINCTQTRMVRSLRPDGESPKLPFSTSAGGKEVTYQEGYNPATTPVINATPPVIKTIGRFFKILKSASTKGKAVVLPSIQTRTKLIDQAIRLTIAASASKAFRNNLSELPRTFWVLILLIRRGVRAVLKLVKLIAATIMINKAIKNNNKVTSLFPLRKIIPSWLSFR